ncbi:MAG TPA: glycosyltransferase, partial [Smithellaceae bacterium]|nr:glycosyltransferase [Smithellaceae bacterium]
MPGRRKKVLFYAAVRDPALFRTMGFYATDIKILEDCGYEVTPTNRLLDFFKYGRYDLAFIYFWTKGLLPAIVAKGLGKKVLFTGGIDALDRGFNRRALDYLIKKWLFRACAALSDANIIVSLSDLANVRQTGVDVSSLHLVPHVIDAQRYAHDGRRKQNWITTVAWMGTKENVQRKGLDRLLRVFGEFVQMDNGYTLMLIGPGGEGSAYLARMASDLDIAGRVVFTGEVAEEEKIRLLKESKYYFQLSAYEGFGISAI